MHIHPSSPNSSSSLQSEEESAAIKIQAGFRGFRVRKQLHSRQNRNGFHQHQRSASHRRQQRYQQQAMELQQQGDASNKTAQNKNVNSVACNNSEADASIEDRCATKIQASVRGFLVRKKQKIETDAATKIQAGFRGFKARKEAQKLKQK